MLKQANGGSCETPAIFLHVYKKKEKKEKTEKLSPDTNVMLA